MTPTQLLSTIDGLFSERGGREYHGESVTQLEHALQSAWLAEKDRQPPSLIAAALLHDLGHLLHCGGEAYLDQSLNNRHEEGAARFLAQAYGPAVTEPIRLHVPAKRYLVATRPGYGELLSPTSIISLELQGGPMGAEAIAAFEGEPHCAAAIALRQYDDHAKVVGLATPAYGHFRRYLVGVGGQ